MTKRETRHTASRLALTAAAAGLVLVVAVLPAEYGIDPTGFGKLTGLVALAETAPAPPRDFGQAMSFNIEPYDPTAERIEQSIRGLIHLEDKPFQTETIDLQIEDLGEIEHKFIMPADTAMLYSWEVLGAKGDGVYFEFHGHPASDDPDYPEGFEQAYSKGEGTGQNGAFTAPFPGYHGWYFMNLEEGPITLRLNVSGYWSDHKEMYRAVDGEVLLVEEF